MGLKHNNNNAAIWKNKQTLFHTSSTGRWTLTDINRLMVGCFQIFKGNTMPLQMLRTSYKLFEVRPVLTDWSLGNRKTESERKCPGGRHRTTTTLCRLDVTTLGAYPHVSQPYRGRWRCRLKSGNTCQPALRHSVQHEPRSPHLPNSFSAHYS